MNTSEKKIRPTEAVPDEQGMRSFLQAFYHWYEAADSPVRQCSRSRVLLVCLLMRFAALRLGEALLFDDMVDIDRESLRLHVRGRRARSLPLPHSVMKRMLELCEAPCNVRERGRLCRLDPAYVRRIFATRAAEAGLSGLRPTALRKFREQELLRYGVSLSAAEFFLGRKDGAPGEEDIKQLENFCRRWEYTHQIGRHNTVQGKLTVLRRGEFSCDLEIVTEGGTPFAVQCSTRTFMRLELAARKTVAVSVRSLQVKLLRSCRQEKNYFCAVVQDVVERGGEFRVMLSLRDDCRQQFCAIISQNDTQLLTPECGATVWLFISPADFTFYDQDQSDL